MDKYINKNLIFSKFFLMLFQCTCFRRLTKIKFSPDSKNQSIGDIAFFISFIEQLTILACICELEPWCYYMSQLQSNKVETNNLNYKTDDENRNLII